MCDICFVTQKSNLFTQDSFINSMSVLPRSTISARIKELPALPVSWFVKRQEDQTLHVLDLRNCSINSISEQVIPNFGLSKVNLNPKQDARKSPNAKNEKNEAASEKGENVLSYPELILKVDFSLNDLEMVTIGDLAIFRELRSLDLSLNAINKFQGIEVAAKLVSLNISYNNIEHLPNESLAECISLQNLDLSVNKISSLQGFPMLPNLIKLNLRYNKLKDLRGLQVLRSIKQLDASKNKLSTVIHICPCLELTELYISDNVLDALPELASALSPLQRLKQVSVKGNPIGSMFSVIEIQQMLAKETSIELMDGTNIRPAKDQFESFSHLQAPSPRNTLKIDLKKAVRESIKEGTEKSRRNVHENIRFLHKKILILLEELDAQEDQAAADTEAWCRYIDTLTLEEAKSLTVSQIRAAALVEPDGYLPIQVPPGKAAGEGRTSKRRA